MNKVILYLDGGAMSGVFSGGVMCALEKIDFYPNIKAIYASSAGAFNAAYFLARQTEEGQDVYLKYLPKGFIHPFNLFMGMPQRLWHRFIKPVSLEKTINIIDIDYVINLLKENNRLNIDNIINSGIPFYIQLFNLDDKVSEYVLASKENMFDILKASSCIPPYTFENVVVNGKRYIDGTIKDPIDIQYLLKQYPEDKIIVVSNRKGKSKARHKMKSFLEGSMARIMYGKEMLPIFMNRDNLADKSFELIEKDPKVILLRAPENCPVGPHTRNYDTLIKVLEIGKNQGMKLKDLI